MRRKKPRLHLILNAHLDPVWQWRWEEGAAEAMATFGNAVSLLRQYPNIIFNHNEALLYRWVEAYNPALFREIQRLVKEGRWSISGGWYLQPDVNLPGLESLVRHILIGRRYFWEKFRAWPKVAYNFDSFGHSGGLPQILRLAGYRMYIHMRPQPHEFSLPSDLYRWQGVDGSQILALRISVGLYHTERDNLDLRLREATELALKLNRDMPVFWGLGNHGGGATREDIERIEAFKKREKRVEIIHSTPDKLYGALREEGQRAPVFRGDLQRVFTGCYTSSARVKRRAEESLGRLVQAEALQAASAWLAGEAYPCEALEEAWRAHLLNDGHDILTGTCIELAERDALDLYGSVGFRVKKLCLGAASALARKRGRILLRPDRGIPLVVLNTNPSLTSVPVEVECMADYRPLPEGRWRLHLYDLPGKEIFCQEEQPEALLPFNDWRRKLSFWAKLAGVGASFFVAMAEPAKEGENQEGEEEAKEGEKQEAFESEKERESANEEAKPYLKYKYDRNSGLINWLDAGAGQSLLHGPLFEPLAILDEGDSWGTGCWSYRNIESRFRLVDGSLRTIADGPIRTVIESVLTNGRSRIIFHTIFYPEWPVLEFRLRVYWNEERRMLKLAVPTSLASPSVLVEVPGGAISRPADGEEHVFGRWAMVRGKMRGREMALAVIASGQHGLDFADGELRLSVLRSPAYCHERGFPLSSLPSRKHMDLGGHEFRLLVTAGEAQPVLRSLASLADWLNAPPFALAHLPITETARLDGKNLSPLHSKRQKKSVVLGGAPPLFPAVELFSLEPKSIRLTASKLSADEKALILRFHETIGEKTVARIRLYHPEKEIQLSFKPFELKTIRVEKSGRWREVNFVLEK